MSVFAVDEQRLVAVDPDWSLGELLLQEGIFFLKDLKDHLGVSVVAKRADVERAKGHAWELMGVSKLWTRWIVRMKVFGPFYLHHLLYLERLTYRTIPSGSRLEDLSDGSYRLAHIVKLIPFTSQQLRYRAQLNPNAGTEYGIFLDGRHWLVRLAVFRPWIKRIWQRGGFE